MEKIRRAFSLMKACWHALMMDKELLLFPVLSMSVLALLLVGIFSPIFFADNPMAMFDFWMNELSLASEWTLGAIGFAAYFVAYLVIIFFNSALIFCVKFRFSGGDPTVMYGLARAMQRLPQIILWALVTSTVGFVLQMLNNKNNNDGEPDDSGGFGASLIIGFIGAAWAIASYFVVPIIVTEKLGPIDAVKRSIQIAKKTWGEAIVSVVGFTAIGGLAGFIGFILVIIGVTQLETVPEIAVILIALGVVWFICTSLIFTTLGAVLKAALYVYAVDGKISGSFDQTLIQNAFSERAN